MILFSPLAFALLPSRWAYFSFGCVVLVAGLLWLDSHVQPFGGNDFGLGRLLLVGWLGLTAIGFFTVLVRPVVARLLSIRSKPQVARLALWPLPMGILIGVFFTHWLSNRLAGATPALLVHMAVGSAGLAAALVVWWFRPRAGILRGLAHGAITVCLTIFAWVAVAGFEAQRWASSASTQAAGAPYCTLTFAARDQPRPAREVLELSRLVSRSGGRSFSEDVSWLVIQGRGGLEVRRSNRIWTAEPFSAPLTPVRLPSCSPELGGGLE